MNRFAHSPILLLKNSTTAILVVGAGRQLRSSCSFSLPRKLQAFLLVPFPQWATTAQQLFVQFASQTALRLTFCGPD